ncbi:P-loop containing nucleoside triphosphate hydrolase protein [Hypoxylon sp. NC0597]|nr:P-loop containing nucleoside triphosphate hydrolase protein [Hypoxylon sp. NC0597]
MDSLTGELEEVMEREREHAEQQQKNFELELLKVTRISDEEIQRLTARLRKEEDRRRALFTQVQKLRGAFRVMCRIRPMSSGEVLKYKLDNGELHGHPAKLTIIEDTTKSSRESKVTNWSTYQFERVFTPEESNADVFSEISEFVQSVVDGKNACVFCYGQSGTGKTYTMSNREDVENREEGIDYKSDGIIPRVRTMIFREKSRLAELGYDMSLAGCCYEIYNNELRLLKADGKEKKTITMNSRVVEEHDGLTTLNSANDFDALVEVGMKSRHFGSTKLNDSSSRSHFIISLKTKIRWKDSSNVVREGLLNLVDLAGSEGTRQAGTTGVEFKEGIKINTSLSHLNRVFKDLAAGRLPAYNENILTKFLQRSLGKDCMTLMFLMISPLKIHWPTTKHTLQFALDVQTAKKADQPSRSTKVAITKSSSSKLPKVPQSSRSKR